MRYYFPFTDRGHGHAEPHALLVILLTADRLDQAVT